MLQRQSRERALQMNSRQCTRPTRLATTQHCLVSKATAAPFVIAAAAAVVVDSASASAATSPVSAYTDAIVSDRRHMNAAAYVTSIRLQHPSHQSDCSIPVQRHFFLLAAQSVVYIAHAYKNNRDDQTDEWPQTSDEFRTEMCSRRIVDPVRECYRGPIPCFWRWLSAAASASDRRWLPADHVNPPSQ